jgi:hypothetical protein
MYDSDRYRVDPALVDAFVRGQRHGTLIATPPDGHPQASLLPFVKIGDQIELHCVQEDPTFAALQASPRSTFWSPTSWRSRATTGSIRSTAGARR